MYINIIMQLNNSLYIRESFINKNYLPDPKLADNKLEGNTL